MASGCRRRLAFEQWTEPRTVLRAMDQPACSDVATRRWHPGTLCAVLEHQRVSHGCRTMGFTAMPGNRPSAADGHLGIGREGTISTSGEIKVCILEYIHPLVADPFRGQGPPVTYCDKRSCFSAPLGVIPFHRCQTGCARALQRFVVAKCSGAQALSIWRLLAVLRRWPVAWRAVRGRARTARVNSGETAREPRAMGSTRRGIQPGGISRTHSSPVSRRADGADRVRCAALLALRPYPFVVVTTFGRWVETSDERRSRSASGGPELRLCVCRLPRIRGRR